MIPKINYGEIWLANLNPGNGTEPGKTRPVLVIQNQSLLDAGHPSTIIIPLTTRTIDGVRSLRVRVHARDRLLEESDLLVDQIRAIDNKRFTEGPIAKCSKDFMSGVLSSLLDIMSN
jgi:mRNA interferase MazF